MALSPSSGFIKPEVWAASVQASVLGHLVLARFATPFDGLTGVPGDSLSLVEFSRLTELSTDTDEDTALVPEVMTSTGTTLTVVEASKAAEISWRAARVAFGDPVGTAADETARVIAARVDTKLKAAAEAAITATSQVTTKAAIISYANVIEATGFFGDSVANGGVSLVIHSKQFRDLLLDANFERTTGGGAGSVGILGGVYPVYVSDRITVDTNATPDTYKALLFHLAPLAYAYKRDIESHQQDDILARSTTVTSTLYYATGAMRDERIAALVTQ